MKLNHRITNLLPGSLRRHVGIWKDLESVYELAAVMDTPAHHIQLLSLNPSYKEYKIRKKNGGFRLIEDPKPELKNLLRKINHYLQAVYHFQRPDSVHGFCISPRHEEDRNVVSNARRHLGRAFLINIDLKDFFHQVSIEWVHGILGKQFPGMNEDLTDLLSRLMTRHGRLPMGAPTSPALSNYACLELDDSLEILASHLGFTYTRYADDLSFSCDQAIKLADEGMIRSLIAEHGFSINEEKVKRYGEGDEKSVTGLIVSGDEVALPGEYYPMLEVEIDRLRAVNLVEQRYRTGMLPKRLKLLKQEIQGKINFAGMALGRSHPEVIQLEEKYEAALFAPEEFESGSWLEIPYGLW